MAIMMMILRSVLKKKAKANMTTITQSPELIWFTAGIRSEVIKVGR
jgi:hypothetical protein